MCRDTITYLEEKGKQTYNGSMKRFLTWLGRSRHPYEPLISVLISKSRILNNLNEFRKQSPGSLVAPVLKSNAYGHGLFEVAEILERADRKAKSSEAIPFFVVDSYFEAVALRARHFKTPLLVIGYTRPETIIRSNLSRTSFVVASLQTLAELSGSAKPISIQLKFDTGMRRQGLLPEEASDAIRMIQNDSHIYLEGICTHFADADNPDTSFTKGQIATWEKIVRSFKLAFPALKYIHAAATDGSVFADQIRNNVSRLGIGLYGLSNNAKLNERLDLKPALKMKTVITGIKTLKADEQAGYGVTFKAEKDMKIATIPVGYYEGIDRRLSNKGFVQIGDGLTVCPIIGRVSMNITIIDISAAQDVKIGTEVVVISDVASDPNSMHSMAAACGTITYEHAVHIPAHLKRIIVA
jgi:alanine racemase